MNFTNAIFEDFGNLLLINPETDAEKKTVKENVIVPGTSHSELNVSPSSPSIFDIAKEHKKENFPVLEVGKVGIDKNGEKPIPAEKAVEQKADSALPTTSINEVCKKEIHQERIKKALQNSKNIKMSERTEFVFDLIGMKENAPIHIIGVKKKSSGEKR